MTTNIKPMNWPELSAPKIQLETPVHVVRAMKAALRCVDQDIERFGSVTYETVAFVRAVRELDRIS